MLIRSTNVVRISVVCVRRWMVVKQPGSTYVEKKHIFRFFPEPTLNNFDIEMRLLTLYLLLFLAFTLVESNSHHHHLRQNQHARSRQHVPHSHHHRVKHRQKQTAKTPKPSYFPTAFGPLAGPNTCFLDAKRFFPEVQKFDPVFMVGFSTQCATAEFKPNTRVKYVWANSTCDDKYPPVSQGSDFVFYWTPKYYSGPYQIEWWLYTESLSDTFTARIRLFQKNISIIVWNVRSFQH